MSIKDDDYIRVYRINPPNLDPETDFPSTDCQHDDLDHLFFGRDVAEPGGKESGPERAAREAKAKAVCAECPFVVACGLHALRFEDYGVWGAMTEQERRALGGRGIGVQGQLPRPSTVLDRLLAAGVPRKRVWELVYRWGQERPSKERAA